MAKRTRKSEVAVASSEEARKFAKSLQEAFRGRKRSRKEKERLREYLAKFDAEYLRSIARRVMIDIVKGPGPSRADGDKSPPQPPPPSPSRRPGGKRATGRGKSRAPGSPRRSAKS